MSECEREKKNEIDQKGDAVDKKSDLLVLFSVLAGLTSPGGHGASGPGTGCIEWAGAKNR